MIKLIFALLVVIVFALGCSETLDVSGEFGCETVEELVRRYESAHTNRDMTSLRSLCFWNLERQRRAGPYTLLESAIEEIFELRLTNVEYVPGPPPPPELGGEIIYYIPGKNQLDRIIGPVHGKLLLLGNGGAMLDPSFVVMKHQDRYYIDVAPLVLVDSAKSLKEGVEPKYVGAPLQRKPDPRKGESPRRFD